MLAKQMIDRLKYVHDCGILYRDLDGKHDHENGYNPILDLDPTFVVVIPGFVLFATERSRAHF